MITLTAWRAAIRMWTRQPAVPCLAILSIAVGIAASTSVFAVADAALWRPLPIPQPDRVVWVATRDRNVEGPTAPGVVAAWESRARSLESIGAFRSVQGTVRDDVGADRVAGALASAGVFRVLGQTAAMVETAAILPFLPGLCRHLLGERIKLPSVATWWCGQNYALDWVEAISTMSS